MSSGLPNLERLCKWRKVFAGWQLGTRSDADAEAAAVRDHREVSIIMRAELSAFVALLVRKGVFTAEEFTQALEAEADQLERDYQRRFPGFKATDIGMEMRMPEVAETMRGWRP